MDTLQNILEMIFWKTFFPVVQKFKIAKETSVEVERRTEYKKWKKGCLYK